MAKVAVILGLMVTAFLLGRSLEDSSSTVSRSTEIRSATPRADRSAFPAAIPRPTMPAAPRPAIDFVEGRRVLAQYREAWRADPDAAERSKNAVLSALEQRRRAHDSDLRACFAAAEVHGIVSILFDVPVRAEGAEITIGDPSVAEVTEGPALSDDVTQCLQHLLRGNDVVTAPISQPFLRGYTGAIDYSASFLFD